MEFPHTRPKGDDGVDDDESDFIYQDLREDLKSFNKLFKSLDRQVSKEDSIKAHEQLKQTSMSLRLFGVIHSKLENFSEAIRCVEKSSELEMSLAEKDTEALVNNLAIKAEILCSIGELVESKKLIEACRPFYRETENEKELNSLDIVDGFISYLEGNLDEAILKLKESYDFFLRSGWSTLEDLVKRSQIIEKYIPLLHEKVGVAAIETIMQDTLQIMEQKHLSSGPRLVLIETCIDYYVSVNDYEKASMLYEKHIKIMEASIKMTEQEKALANLCLCKVLPLNLDNYERSITLYNKCAKTLEEFMHPYSIKIGKFYHNFSHFLIFHGKLAQAQPLLSISKEIFIKRNYLQMKEFECVLTDLIHIHEKKGNRKKAAKYERILNSPMALKSKSSRYLQNDFKPMIECAVYNDKDILFSSIEPNITVAKGLITLSPNAYKPCIVKSIDMKESTEKINNEYNFLSTVSLRCNSFVKCYGFSSNATSFDISFEDYSQTFADIIIKKNVVFTEREFKIQFANILEGLGYLENKHGVVYRVTLPTTIVCTINKSLKLAFLDSKFIYKDYLKNAERNEILRSVFQLCGTMLIYLSNINEEDLEGINKRYIEQIMDLQIEESIENMCSRLNSQCDSIFRSVQGYSWLKKTLKFMLNKLVEETREISSEIHPERGRTMEKGYFRRISSKFYNYVDLI